MSDKKIKQPKVRFKEFAGENADPWEQRKVGELGNVITGSTPSTNNQSYYSDDGIPWVTPTDISENITFETAKKLSNEGQKVGRVVPKNTILVTCIASIGKNTMLGTVGSFNQQINGLVPNEEQTNPYFLFTESSLWSATMKKFAAAGTMQIVNKKDFSELHTWVPKKAEQDRIGDFFRSLDNLIALHQRELDNTKTLKQTMLSKMFPKEDSNVPEFRFAGFTDPWEQRKFADVFNILQNNTLSRALLNYENGVAMNVHYGDILVKFGDRLDVSKDDLPYITDEDSVSKYKASFLDNGDVVIADAAEDATVGKCTEIAGLTSQTIISGLHTIPCRPLKNFASGYLGYYMNSTAYHNQLLPLIQGTKISSISKTALKGTKLKYPESLEEQWRIADFFIHIDNLITLHQRELETYKTLKKTMLDKMFV